MDGSKLKGLLVQLPALINYDHSRLKEAKSLLREEIWKLVTCEGKYNHLYSSCKNFPYIDLQDEPTSQAPVLCRLHRGRPCVRKLCEGEPTYRCITCGVDETCVLCKYCFDPENHQNHEVSMKINDLEDGGICDCGDHEAWKQEIACLSERLAGTTVEEPELPPSEVRESLTVVCEILLNFINDTSVSYRPNRNCVQSAEEARQSMADSALSSAVYGVEEVPGNGRFALLMWNDECHSYDDAVIAIQAITRKTMQFALMIAHRIDEIGYSPLMISNNLASLLAERMRNGQLCTTIISTRELCRLSLAGEILSWLQEISQVEPPALPPDFISSVMGDVLLAPWEIGNATVRTQHMNDLELNIELDIHNAGNCAKMGMLYHGLVPEPPNSFVSASDASRAGSVFASGQFRSSNTSNEVSTVAAQANTIVGGGLAAPIPETLAPTEPQLGDTEPEQVPTGVAGDSPLPDSDFDSLIAADKQVTFNDLARIQLYDMLCTGREFDSPRPGVHDICNIPNPVALREHIQHSHNPGNFDGKLQELNSPLWYKFAEESDRDTKKRALRQFKSGSSKVSMLIYFDSRLPKKYRRILRDLYIFSLISDKKRKQQLGLDYANIYPQCCELCMFVDKEPESAVLPSLSTQLFTTPSLASRIIDSSEFQRLMAGLYTTLANSNVGGPSAISARENCSVQKASLASARLILFFREVTFLLASNQNKRSIVTNPGRVLLIADILSLFEKISPMQRQQGSHVEFESQSWVYLFLKIPIFLKLAQTVAQDAQSCDYREVIPSIQEVAKLLCLESELCSDWPGAAESRDISIKVECGRLTETYQVEAFGSRGETISLHHPVHTFLAYLLSYTRFPTSGAMRNALNLQNSRDGELLFVPAMETVAVLSQIHVGLWVRNGYTVKNQMHQFREGPLRDYVYLQHLFLIQTAMVAMDPSHCLLLLEVKWHLVDWTSSDYYEDSQAFYMLEEYLHLILALMTERTHLLNLSPSEARRESFKREIVQNLAFKSMSFSELIAQILESSYYEEAFESALEEVATFSPPKGLREVGKHILKPEARHLFNTHWVHFSSARIEEAEELVKAWKSEEDTMSTFLSEITPLPELWSDLCAFTRTLVFRHFFEELFQTLFVAPPELRSHVEVVLSKALFVLLRAAQCDLECSGSTSQGTSFDSFAGVMVSDGCEGSNLSLLDQLLTLKDHHVYCSLYGRVKDLIKLLGKKDPVLMQPYLQSISEPENTPAINVASQLKQKGKAEKLKVMEEFKRQQALFAQTLGRHDLDENVMDDQERQNSDCDAEDEEATPGPNAYVYPDEHCVLCHVPLLEGECYGVMTHTQLVRVQRNVANFDPYWLVQSYGNDGNASLDQDIPYDISEWFKDGQEKQTWVNLKNEYSHSAYPSSSYEVTTVMSGCGHCIHASCYDDYIKSRAAKSQQLTRTVPDRFEKGEYLCVLCQGLNNGLMIVNSKQNSVSTENLFFRCTEADLKAQVERVLHNGQLPHCPENMLSFAFNEIPSDTVEKLHENPANTDSISLTGYVLRLLRRVEQVWKLSEPIPVGRNGAVSALMDTYANTLSTMEISLRGVGHSSPFTSLIVDQLSNQQVLLLRAFSDYIRTTMGVLTVLDKTFQFAFPDIKEFIGERSPFASLVYMLYIFCPLRGLHPYFALWSMLLNSIAQFLNGTEQLVQVLSVGKTKGLVIPGSKPCTNEIREFILRFTENKDTDPEVLDMLYSMLTRHIQVFLRQAALLVFGLCGSYDPDDFACMRAVPEHDRLCQYLGLPQLQSIILDIHSHSSPVSDWFDWFYERKYKLHIIIPEFAGVYRLIDLPPRLDLFFDSNIYPGREASEPALCLFCGARVDMHGNAIIMPVGPCNSHMALCSRVSGMFIVPKRNCLLLLMRDERGSFTKAPYLDSHGDYSTDAIKRGRPHYLQYDRYQALVKSLWLEHGLASFIAQKLETNIDVGGWETL